MTDRWNGVYWLGGSPCSGKSSIATALVEQFGLHYYKCDDHFDHHLKIGESRGLPTSSILRVSNHEYVFMRSHEENVRLAFDIFQEEFDLVLEDIASLPKPLLVEGCTLLPNCLAHLDISPGQAYYLVPTEQFFRTQYAKRLWAKDRLKETSNPALAYENWMKRDITFAQNVAATAQSHGFLCQWIDGQASIQATAHTIATHFNLAPLKV